LGCGQRPQLLGGKKLIMGADKPKKKGPKDANSKDDCKRKKN